MRRWIVVMISVFACACGDAVEKFGIKDSGPTTYETLRIQGPAEVKIGETAQYRSFARLLGANQEVETTTIAFWSATPVGRLTVGATGSALGVSEGALELQAIINGGTARMNVNVVGAVPPGELLVSCPSSLRIGERGNCKALATDVELPVTGDAEWGSSESAVAVAGKLGAVTALGEGKTYIVALYKQRSGQSEVIVTPGEFATAFTPVINGCGMPIRTALTGSMTVRTGKGDLLIGGGRQEYSLTLTLGDDDRLRISAQSSVGGFDYALEVTQVTPGARMFTGREDIRGPGGCAAQYTVTMERS